MVKAFFLQSIDLGFIPYMSDTKNKKTAFTASLIDDLHKWNGVVIYLVSLLFVFSGETLYIIPPSLRKTGGEHCRANHPQLEYFNFQQHKSCFIVYAQIGAILVV